MRLAVLASGSGTILDAICAAGIPVATVVVDRECRAQEVAARNGLACEFVQRSSYGNDFDRDGYTAELLGVLSGWDIELVAMAVSHFMSRNDFSLATVGEISTMP